MVRFYAFIGVLAFIALLWRYTCEFDYFSNTIGLKPLLWGSVAVGMVSALAFLYLQRTRFSPLSRHYPEILFIVVMTGLFSPLLGSWLNRLAGTKQLKTFQFISEKAYYASGYGVLKGETIMPTGWVLTVNDNGTVRQFKYKTQAYYPISNPGDLISLPVVHGLFGVDVVAMDAGHASKFL